MSVTHIDMMAFEVQPLGKEEKKKLKKADRLFEKASLKAQVGRYEEAEAMYKECLILKGRILNAANPVVININLVIGNMWISQHEFQKAEPFFVNANKFAQKALAEDAGNDELKKMYRKALRELAFLYYLQGSVLKGRSASAQQGLWKRAEESFKKVITTTEEELGRSSIELVEPLRNLASLYVKTGNFHKSEILFKRCIGIQLVNKGNTDPVLLFTRQQLAIVCERREQHKALHAVKMIQQAFLIMKAKKEAQRRREELKMRSESSPLQGGAESANTIVAGSTAPVGYFTPGTENFKDFEGPDGDDGSSRQHSPSSTGGAAGINSRSPIHTNLNGGGGGAGDQPNPPTSPPAMAKSPLVPPANGAANRTVCGIPITFIAADNGDAKKLANGEEGDYKLTEEEMDILNCFPMLGGDGVIPPQLVDAEDAKDKPLKDPKDKSC